MRAKAQLSRSDLPKNIGKKPRRKALRASFPPGDVAHGMKPEVKDILEVLKAMQVVIPETSEVSEYLLAHSDLSCLISPICSKLIKTFSDDAKLFLETYRDPEIHDEYLTIYIRKNEYENMILDRIDEAISEFEPALGDNRFYASSLRARARCQVGRAVRGCGAVARAGGIAWRGLGGAGGRVGPEGQEELS